jgi:PAS domain S-box-containing protein
VPPFPANASATRRRVTAAFALAATLLLAVGSVTVWGLGRIAAARDDRQDAVAVRDGLNRLLVHFQDAETGQRGFLLTGNDLYLQPFQTGSALVRSDLDTLVQLTASDAAVAGRVQTLTPAIEAKLSELSLTVGLRRSRGFAAALRVVLTDQGRILMDSVRQIARGIGGIENRRYSDAGTLVQRTTTWVQASSVIGTLLAMGFLVLAAVVQRRDSRSREMAEGRLAAMSAELTDLYEQAPCGYHSLDTDGLVTRMNHTECRWLGYQLDEIVGRKSLFDLIAPEDRPRARERFQQLVGGVDIGTGEARFVRKDGTRVPFLVSSILVRDAAGAPWRVRATMMDQTAFRSAREQVDRLNAQLQRHVTELEDLNQELEKFSYSISHDLRAPLRAISGFARLLTEEHAANLDAEALRLLGVIHVNTERMGRLIDDLLSLSRFSRQELVRTPVDMTALVSRVIADRAAAQAPGSAEIVVADLPNADGDPALLTQVWERLIDNGVKFTEGIKAPRVEIGARADNGTTVYSVRDNGVGFDMQYAAKVFEVFQRLHAQSDYEGTGMGLAIVQRLIHRHGGRIWAESAPGRGATFFFTLGAKGGAG